MAGRVITCLDPKKILEDPRLPEGRHLLGPSSSVWNFSEIVPKILSTFFRSWICAFLFASFYPTVLFHQAGAYGHYAQPRLQPSP